MRISRMELYEKIWSTGTSKTATELNVPYDKLKSACTEHNIPLPSLKYWGLLHKGKETPEKTPLLHPEQNDEIILVANKAKTIAPTEEGTPKSLPKSKVNAQIAAEKPVPQQSNYFNYFSSEEQKSLLEAYHSLKLTKTLSTKPHPEIVKFKHKQKHPDSYYQREPKLVIKSASEEIFPEAFIFIDHLLKGLEKAEATIRVKESQTEVYYKHYVFSLILKSLRQKLQ